MLFYLYETEVLLKITPETKSSMKKECLVLLSPFYIGLRIRDPRSGIRIRDEKIIGSGSGLKHPGSATLVVGELQVPGTV
jgi:hypothetical protein